MKITSLIRSPLSGEPEFTRVLGVFGVFVYIVAAQVFVGYEVFYMQRDFDLTAYCAAFPGGLAVAIGTVATAAGFKDRNVATAQKTAATTAATNGELPESEKIG
ncbi:MAG TPA: hypothetical protein VLG09_04020 [Candidatus Saccharimonadales bacterium]|nr:hypothetical protein [Candidatus Saccharimonadales bacterium]